MLLGDSDRTQSLLHQYYRCKATFRSVLVKSHFYFLLVFPTNLSFCSLSEASLTGPSHSQHGFHGSSQPVPVTLHETKHFFLLRFLFLQDRWNQAWYQDFPKKHYLRTTLCRKSKFKIRVLDYILMSVHTRSFRFHLAESSLIYSGYHESPGMCAHKPCNHFSSFVSSFVATLLW